MQELWVSCSLTHTNKKVPSQSGSMARAQASENAADELRQMELHSHRELL